MIAPVKRLSSMDVNACLDGAVRSQLAGLLPPLMVSPSYCFALQGMAAQAPTGIRVGGRTGTRRRSAAEAAMVLGRAGGSERPLTNRGRPSHSSSSPAPCMQPMLSHSLAQPLLPQPPRQAAQRRWPLPRPRLRPAGLQQRRARSLPPPAGQRRPLPQRPASTRLHSQRRPPPLRRRQS